MNKNLGLNLKILREKFGISQEELAAHIGLKNAAISKYEKNMAEPKIDHLIKFCEIFNVTLDELILDTISSREKLSEEDYMISLKELKSRNEQLEIENSTLKVELDKLQKRLITALETLVSLK